MNTQAIEVRPGTELARPLTELVPLIRQKIQEGDDFYFEAGLYLIEAKPQVVESGDNWDEWVWGKFNRKPATVADWMRGARIKYSVTETVKNHNDASKRARNATKPVEFKTVSEAIGKKRGGDSWHVPVQEILSDRLNVPRMRQEIQDKEKEEKLQRQLGLQLIDIGYKVLATKLHPDKGGSPDAMARLNRVRDILKGAI